MKFESRRFLGIAFIASCLAPGSINYATSGAGNPFHLATAMFEH